MVVDPDPAAVQGPTVFEHAHQWSGRENPGAYPPGALEPAPRSSGTEGVGVAGISLVLEPQQPLIVLARLAIDHVDGAPRPDRELDQPVGQTRPAGPDRTRRRAAGARGLEHRKPQRRNVVHHKRYPHCVYLVLVGIMPVGVEPALNNPAADRLHGVRLTICPDQRERPGTAASASLTSAGRPSQRIAPEPAGIR